MTTKKYRKAVLGIFFITFLTFISSSAYALPQDAQVVNGDVKVEQVNGNTMNITASENAIVNYHSFNIAQNETVNFFQPNMNSFCLNRVTGGIPSQIFGQLNANGNIVLVNTNGINFGNTAQVNVGGLIASTRDISNADFIAGRYIFGTARYDMKEMLKNLVNNGNITAREGGFAVLIGSAVENNGVIHAPLGNVSLASGDVVTVGISGDGMVSIAIDQPVTGEVLDLNGNKVSDQISNKGSLNAGGGHVIIKADAVKNIFHQAVNLEGHIRADRAVMKDGVIEIVASGSIAADAEVSAEGGEITVSSEENIEVQGTYKAPEGKVTFEAGEAIAITGETSTQGDTTFRAQGDIAVNADVTTDSGDLVFRADSDKDGKGAFLQAADTTIRTTTWGDITIESSGDSTIANIESAGDLTLEQAGAPVTYTQQPGSVIKTEGSLAIQPGATLKAADTHYEIAQNWINLGNFIPDVSVVQLVGIKDARILGDNTFNDLKVIEPGKTVAFDADKTQKVVGILTLQGGFGKLLLLRSTQPGIIWKIDAQGAVRDMANIDVMDSTNVNIHGPPLAPLRSKNSLNNSGWDFSQSGPLWTGTISPEWSNPLNWDGGFIPASGDIARFNSLSSSGHFSDSLIDASFSGSIHSLVLEAGFEGTVALGRDLTASHDITLGGGNLSAGDHILTLGGNWSNSGGNFQAGTSTVVFNDADQITTISGNNTFWNFSCETPTKTVMFEAGSTQTIQNHLKLVGAPDLGPVVRYIKIRSTGDGMPWFLNVEDTYFLERVDFKDTHSLTHLTVPIGVDSGNNHNFDIDPLWDGEGSTNNWSEAQNWDGNQVPKDAETVTFGTETGEYRNKDCTINNLGDWTNGHLIINSYYEGKITLSATAMVVNDFTQANGTFETGGNTLTINGNFTHTAGTFTASANSTIKFIGNDTTINVPDTETFYNLTIEKNDGKALTVAGSDVITVTGVLTLTDGELDGGTIDVQGSITLDSQFDGGNGLIRYSSAAATTLGTGRLPRLTLDNNSGSITISDGILIIEGTLTIANGTFNFNPASANDLITVQDYLQTGGTFAYHSAFASELVVENSFSLEAGTFSFTNSYGELTTTGNFSQTGGTFNGNDGVITINGNFSLTGDTATFTAPTDTNGALTIKGDFTHSGSSTFSANNGAVTLSGDSSTINVPTGGDNFCRLNIDKNDGKILTILGGPLIAKVQLVLIDGGINTGTIEAREQLDLSAPFDGGTGSIIINGEQAQSISFSNGGKLPDFTIDNPSATVTGSLSGKTLTVGAFTLLNGKFQADAGNIEMASYDQSEGTFQAGIGTLSVSGNFTQSGGYFYGFTDNTSRITVTGTTTISDTAEFYAGMGECNFTGAFTQTGGTFNGQTATINMNGDLTVSGGDFNSTSIILDVKGNLSFAASTFTHNSGTLKLSGTAVAGQTLVTNGAILFYNLTITNSSAGGVYFNGGFSTAAGGTFTAETPNTTLIFNANSDYSFYGIGINGQSPNTKITLKSSTTGTAYKFIAFMGTPDVQYADVSDCNNTYAGSFITAYHSKSSGNNSRWTFASENCYWTSSTAGNWFTAGNWLDGKIPGGSDTAIFNSSSSGNCTLDSDVSIGGLMLDTLYANTVNTDGHNLTTSANVDVNGGTLEITSNSLLTVGGNLGANSGSGSTIDASAGSLDVAGNVSLYYNGELIAPASGSFTVGGNWEISSSGKFTPGTGTVTFDGTGAQTLKSDGEAFFNLTHSGIGTLTLSSDPLTVEGTFTNSNGTFDDGNQAMTFGGNWRNDGSATFTRGTGTLTFDGDGLIFSTAATLGKIVISDGKTVTLESNVTIETASGGTINLGSQGYILTVTGTGQTSGTPLTSSLASGTNSTVQYTGDAPTDIYNLAYNHLTLSGDGPYYLMANTTITGNLTIDSAATLDVTASNYSFTLAGNWSNSGIFNARGGTVTFSADSPATQTLNAGSSPFHKINHSGTGTLQLTADLTVSNDFTNSGIFDLNGHAWTMSSATFSNPGTIRLKGTEAINGLTQDIGQGLWEYVGSGTDPITLNDFGTIDYYDLKVSGTASEIFDINNSSSLTVAHNFTITSGDFRPGIKAITVNGTLKVDGSGGKFTGTNGNITAKDILIEAGTFTAPPTGTFTVSGDWTKSGGTFTPGTGTVNFNGSAGTTQELTSGSSSFFSLTHSGAGTLQLQDPLDVNGNFTQSAGIFDANGKDQNFAGHFSLSSGTTYTKGGTLTFDGTGDLTDSTTGLQDLGDVVIGGPSTTRMLQKPVKMTALTVNPGCIFDLAGQNFTFSNPNTPATNNGTIRLQGGETLANVSNLDINSGTVEYVGEGASRNFPLRSEYYDLHINDIHEFLTDTFEFTGNTSIHGSLTLTDGKLEVSSGTLTVSNNWDTSGGTFTAGSNTTVDFNGGNGVTQELTSGGQPFYNLTHSGAGTLQLQDSLTVSGTFTNSAGTFDDGDQDMTFSGDWENTATFTRGSGTMTFNGITEITNDSPDSLGIMTFSDNAQVTMQSGLKIERTTGSGTLHTGTGTYTLEITGDGNPNGAQLTIDSEGNSTVIYSADGSTTVKQVPYNNLEFTGNGPYTLEGHLVVSNAITGSLTIGTDAELNAADKNIELKGNFVNNGSFTAGTGTVTFSSQNADQTLKSNGSQFYNLAHSNTYKLSLSDPLHVTNNLEINEGALDTTSGSHSITVEGDLTLTNNGELSANSSLIKVGGDWDSSFGTFTCGTSTVEFNGSSAQSVTSGSATFYNLTVSNTDTVSGVYFQDGFTATNFTDITPSSKLTFESNAIYTITGGSTALHLDGGAPGTKIQLRASTSGDPSKRFTFALSSDQTVNYVAAADGAVSGGKTITATNSTDNGNNDANWLFGLTFYWISNSSGLWGNAANWSLTPNGSAASDYPKDNDTAIFQESSHSGNCGLSSNVIILGLILNGYTGTIDTGNSNLTIANACTVGSGTLIVGAGKTLAVDETLTLSGGTLDATNGIIDANNISISGGEFKAPATGEFFVSGDWTNSGGSFNHNDGEVTFTGGGPATIDVDSSETFYNLLFEKDDGITTTIAAGDSVVATGTCTFSDGKVDAETGAKIEAEGDVTVASTFDGGTAPLDFTGTGSRSFNLDGATDKFTAAVTVNNSDLTVSLASALTASSLTIAAGTFDLSGNNLTVSGAFSVDDYLRLEGGETITGTPTFHTGSTAYYDGATGPYTIKNYAYRKITINGGSVTDFYLPNDITALGGVTVVNGTLNLCTSGSTGQTLTIGADGSPATLNVYGGTLDGSLGDIRAYGDVYVQSGSALIAPASGKTFDIHGSLLFLGGTFTHNSGNITFSGDTDQGLSTASVTFNNIEIDISNSKKLTVTDPLNIDGNLTITNGSLILDSDMTLKGNLSIASGGALTKGTGTFSFKGANDATWTDSTGSGQDLGTVSLEKDSGKKVTLGSDVKATAVTVNSGNTLNLGGHKLILTGGTSPLAVAGTLAVGTTNSGVTYQSPSGSDITLLNIDYGTLTLDPAGSRTFKVSSSGLTLSGDLAIGSKATLDTSSNYGLSIDGNVDINGTLKANGSEIEILGNWDASGGTFTCDTSTVLFNGSSAQSVTSGSATFYNLTVSNTDTVSGVYFQDGFTATNFTDITPSSKLTFESNAIYTITGGSTALHLDGGAPGTKIQLRASTSGDPAKRFTFTLSADQTVDYVNVADGAVSGGKTITARNSTSSGNNGEGWLFGLTRYWIGVSNSFWNNTGNWSDQSGSSGGFSVPGASDTAIFDDGGNVDCSLDIDATVTTLTLDSTYSNTLTIDAGKTLAVDGTLTVSGGTLDATNGIIDANNISLSGGELKAPLTGNTFTVSGDWTHSGGTFTPGTGTVTFTGEGPSAIDVDSSEIFRNLTFQKDTDTATTTIAANDTLKATGILTFSNGKVDAETGAKIEAQGDAYVIPTFDGGTAPLHFTGGASNQNFDLTDAADKFTGNIVINKPSGTVTLSSALIAAQDFTIAGATFDLSGNNLSVGGTFDVYGILRLMGGETITTPTLQPGSTVYYDGAAGPYTIKEWAYKNLTVNGGSMTTFYLPGDITVANDLTLSNGELRVCKSDNTAQTLTVDGTLIISGGTLDATNGNVIANGNVTLSAGEIKGPGTGKDFSIFGDLTLSGTGIITKGTGTVTFNDAGDITDSTASPQDLGNVVIDSAVRTLQSKVKMTALTINSDATLDLNGSGIEVTGGFLNNGTVKLIGSETGDITLTQDSEHGTWEYVGNSDSTVDTFSIKNFGLADYYNLLINDTHSTKDIFQENAGLKVKHDFTISGGTYDANSNTTTVDGICTVNTNGIYDAKSATQTFNGALNIAGGEFKGGTGNVSANAGLSMTSGTLTAPSGTFEVTGNFSISGGTFTPGSYTVTMYGPGTITLPAGQAFSNLTIESDTITLGSAITINNNLKIATGATLDASNSNYNIFIGGQWGGSGYEGSFEARQGTVDFTKASGLQEFYPASSPFYSILHSGAGELRMKGNLTVTGDFDNQAGTFSLYGNDWTMTGAFLSNTGTIQLQGSETILGLDGHTDTGTWQYVGSSGTNTFSILDITFNDLIINGGDDTFSASSDLSVNGDFTLINGKFNANDFKNTVTGLTTISGGEYLAKTGTQKFDGGLTISDGTFTGSSGTVEAGNVTLSSGTLTAPGVSGDFNIAGDFLITGGTFTHNGGTITFNGSADQTFTTYSQTFYGITLNQSSASNQLTVSGTLTMDGDLTLTKGTLDLATHNPKLYLKGNLDIRNGASVSKASGSGSFFYFNGTSPQTWSDANTTKQDIGKIQISNNLSTSTDVTAEGFILDPSKTFDITDDTLTLTDTSENPMVLSGTLISTGSTIKLTGGAGTINLPDLSGASHFNNLILQPASATTYNLGTGYTGDGALTGNLTIDADAKLNTNNRSIEIAGDLTNNGTLTASSLKTITVGGNWTNSGTFEKSGGTVAFNGSTEQKVTPGASPFYNLTHSGAGTLKLLGNLTVTNNFIHSTGGFNAGGYLIDTYDVTLSGGNFTAPSTTFTISGNMNLSELANFYPNGGTVVFDGDTNLTSAGKALGNVQIGSDSAKGTLTLMDNAEFTGDLTVKDGGETTLSFENLTLTFSGEYFDLTKLGSLTATGSTIIFNGTNAQHFVPGTAAGTDTFERIQIENTSGTGSDDGVFFDGAFTVTKFIDTTLGSRLNFMPGVTFTVTDTFTLNGKDAGTRILLRSQTPEAPYTIHIGSEIEQDVFYIDAEYCNISGTTVNAYYSLGSNPSKNNSGAWNWVAASSIFWWGTQPGGFWNTPANWSSGLVPGSSDEIYFNADYDNPCTLDIAVSVTSLTLGDYYSQTLDLNGWNLTTSGDLTLSGGTISVPASSTLAVDGTLTVSGGTLNAANGNLDTHHVLITSGTLIAPVSGRDFMVSGDWTYSGGTFTPGDGLVTFDGTTTVTSNGSEFNAVQIGSGIAGGSLTLADDAILNGDLSVTNGGTTSFDLGGNTLLSSGSSFDLTNLDTLSASGSTLILDGDTTLTGDGKSLGNVQIGSDTQSGSLTLADDATFTGNLTLKNGDFDALSNDCAVDITGTLTLISGHYYTGTKAESVGGNLDIQSDGTLTISSGTTFNVAGDWTNNGTFSAGTGSTVNLNGDDQTILGTSEFYNLTKQTITARTLTFDADHPTTIHGYMTLSGSPGVRLSLRKTGSASQFTLTIDNPTGHTLDYLDVKDSIASRSVTATHSHSSGNNTNWNFSASNIYWLGTQPGGFWNTPSNWDSGFVPDSGDGIYFNSDYNNPCTLDSGVSVASLTLESSYSQTLNLNGWSLTTSGDFTLAGGTISVPASSTLAVDGILTVSGGTLNAANGNLDTHHVLITSGTLIAPVSGRDFTVSGNWTKSGGTFTPGTGTVTFDGNAAQTISGANTWYNLVINNSAASPSDANDVEPSTAQTVINTLTIQDGQWTPFTGDDYQDVSILPNGIMKPDSAASINVAGNWTNAGIFIHNYGLVTFDGTSAGKTITPGGASFYNLTFNGIGGAWTLQDSIDVNGNLAITNGSLAAGTNSINIAGSFSNGGTFTTSGLVTFDGTSAGKTITSGGAEFHNLTFNGIGGAWTLQDPLDINGNLAITNGSLAAGTNSINIEGFFTILGTFTPGTGTVTFDGPGTQTLNPGTSGFFNLTHSGSGTLQLITNHLTVSGAFANSNGIFDANGLTNTVTGLTTLSGGEYMARSGTQTFNGGLTISGGIFTGSTGAVDVNGNLVLSGGTLTAPTGTFTVAGDWTNSEGTFAHSNGTVTFDGTNQSLTSGGDSFYNLIHSGSGTLTLEGPLNVANDLTNSAGTINGNSQDIVIARDLLVNGVKILWAGSIDVNRNVVIATGATLSAPTGLFTVAGDWTNNGTFENNFGTVNFDGADQNLASGDEDFFDLIHSGSGSLTLLNPLTVSRDLTHSAGTLDTNGENVTVARDLLINGGTFTGSTGSLDVNRNVIIASGATLIAPTGTFTVGGDLTNSGTFAHSNGTVTFDGTNQSFTPGDSAFYDLTHSGSGTLTLEDDLAAANDLINSGTFDANGFDVEIDGLLDILAGTYIAGAGAQTFGGGVTLHGGPAPAAFIGGTGPVAIIGNLFLGGGNFTAPSGTLKISGDFNASSGNFNANGGTVELDGGDQTIYGSNTFNNLTKNSSAAATLYFEAYTEQTVNGTCTLKGSSGNKLKLRSTAPGTQWAIDPSGSRDITYVDVQDSDNTNTTAIAATNSVDSLGNTNWTITAESSNNNNNNNSNNTSNVNAAVDTVINNVNNTETGSGTGSGSGSDSDSDSGSGSGSDSDSGSDAGSDSDSGSSADSGDSGSGDEGGGDEGGGGDDGGGPGGSESDDSNEQNNEEGGGAGSETTGAGANSEGYVPLGDLKARIEDYFFQPERFNAEIFVVEGGPNAVYVIQNDPSLGADYLSGGQQGNFVFNSQALGIEFPQFMNPGGYVTTVFCVEGEVHVRFRGADGIPTLDSIKAGDSMSFEWED